MTAKDKFKDWARSFSVCDGGNPKGDWFCGIEFGMGDVGQGKKLSPKEYEERVYDYYHLDLKNEIEKGAFTPDPTFDLKNNLTYQFGLKLGKLYTVVKGRDPQDVWDFAEKSKHDELFKVNLYPIPFADTSHTYWEKYKLEELTRFSTKQTYITWCALNRFPAFAEKVKENSPGLIVCCGVSYLTEFFMCFAGVGGSAHINYEKIKSDDGKERDMYWARINDDKTLLVVTPFFGGPSGLNSDSLIKKFGERIKGLLEANPG